MDIEQFLAKSLAEEASDVYLLPRQHYYRLKVRYPTVIKNLRQIDEVTAQTWINYLKYRAGMNLSEHRRVQQGALWLDSAKCYVRLSTAGDYQNRESIVIRLIRGVPPVGSCEANQVQQLVNLAAKRGLLAICGPTGSGKTTLMYQIAQRLAIDRMVMTIEDPVEIEEKDFLQLQVNAAAGMTYASLLKAALRHRPDVVIIGERRDTETARAACEAALAGHIVMATVHTRGPADVRLRLISLGVPTDLVNSALRVSAQVELVAEPELHPLIETWTWNDGQGHILAAPLAASGR